ncbi:SMI1/KNR4 family protein [Myceligenerans xiligouense]|uniref:SUKH superfamily protein n=1 Tax=Myceligenerans xiligouense TaxID=253184 RepID=A0A3N4YJX8_9MICO|nr:SMI1/KNR4 family protein [Myceligenerans xiligouense]RPF21429.1 SUKH superfamily protein [Myceligenerans xiligouense]
MTAGGFLRASTYWTGPDLTDGLVSAAEEKFGYCLPTSLVDLLYQCNGGVPAGTFFRMTTPTSWAPDHFEIDAILGIGGPRGFYNEDDTGSDYLIREWGYPPIGVVLCATPSGGHDTVMLDYRALGPAGEPAVAYIDEDRVPQKIADSFADFMTSLETPDDYDR